MKEKILYIHPNSLQKRESQVVIPIGMIGVGNIVSKMDNVEFKAISIPLEEYIKSDYNIEDEIKKYNPKIVMVDLHWAIYSYSSINICDKVKHINSSTVTIIGGITASIYYNEIIRNYTSVDYIIRGDSEKIIEPLITGIINKESDMAHIPNIIYRKNNKIIENDMLYECTSFDDIDYCNYDFLKHRKEFFKKQGVHKGVAINDGLAWIPTARGCNYNCSYCGGNKNMFKTIFKKQTMLINSPENIVNSMQKLYDKYGIDVFGITHTFEVFPKEFKEEIIDRIKKMSFKPGFFYYLFQLPQPQFMKELVSILNQEKTVIGLSVMTGDENIRAQNGKPFKNNQLFKLLDVLKNNKVKIELYFMDDLKYSNNNTFLSTKEMINYIYEEYKYKNNLNIDISYGFEIIQPLSEKYKNNCVFNSFKDYYYRYSPQFDIDIHRGKNKEYFIGEKDFDKDRYKRVKEINDLIFKNEKRINKDVDVLYICPPSCKQKEFEKTIGLGYLEANIKENGYNAKQFIPKSLCVDGIMEEIIEINPKIVGFSIYDTNYYYCKLLAKRLKQINPDIIIIAGGPTATFNSDLIMNDTRYFDYCQKGYGEIPTIKLLNYELRFEGKLSEIEGLVYRQDNELKENKLKELPKNIDIFPSPYLSDIDFFPERKIVFTSRGCVYNCVYCNCKSMCNRKVYYHSINRVISELKFIANKEPDAYVLIGDDAFTINIERAKKICQRIIDENIKLKLFCETRVDRIDDELLYLLKKAGFIKIDFGLESAEPRILRNIKKIFYSEDDINYEKEKRFLKIMEKTIKKTQELGLDPMVNIITGLPGENINDAKKTLEYITKLNINSYSHNYLKIYAGTEMFYKYRDWGYDIKQDDYKLPFIVKYPYDVSIIKPLYNSVNRNEVVRIKKVLIDLLYNKQKSCNINNINEYLEKLKNIEINSEVFVWIYNINDTEKISKIFVENDIPTNNINYILDKENQIECFNNLDRENYIIGKKIKNNYFSMPKNYNELLYVREFNIDIEKRFKELGVNPFVNKFVVLENYYPNLDYKYWNDLVKDYCLLYDKDKNDCIMSFLKYINYDVEQLNMDIFRNIIKQKTFENFEIKTIIKFLRYYLLGDVNYYG